MVPQQLALLCPFQFANGVRQLYACMHACMNVCMNVCMYVGMNVGMYSYMNYQSVFSLSMHMQAYVYKRMGISLLITTCN